MVARRSCRGVRCAARRQLRRLRRGCEWGAVRQLTRDPGEDARPAWSHDGRWIYFSSDRSGRNELWRMTADGTEPMQITNHGAGAAIASTDGQWIYYQSFSPPFVIRRARPDGSGDTVVVDGNVGLAMVAATGRGLWFTTGPIGGQAGVTLRMLRVSDNAIVDVAPIPFTPIPVGLSISPDERYALVTRGDTSGTNLLLVDGFR